MNPNLTSYSKDFKKLIKDENGLTNYFIQVIINRDSSTLHNIEKKYNDAIQSALNNNDNNNNNKSKLVIFLCDIGLKKSILKYEVRNDKLTFKEKI